LTDLQQTIQHVMRAPKLTTPQREPFQRAIEPGSVSGRALRSTLAILALTSEACQAELVQISVDRFGAPATVHCQR